MFQGIEDETLLFKAPRTVSGVRVKEPIEPPLLEPESVGGSDSQRPIPTRPVRKGRKTLAFEMTILVFYA